MRLSEHANQFIFYFWPLWFFGVSFNCLIMGLVLVVLPPPKFVSVGRVKMFMKQMWSMICWEVSVLFPSHKKGAGTLLVSIFTVVVVSNLLGLTPYIFTSTAHLVITLSLALPLWVGYYLAGWVESSTGMLAHMVPQGTPTGLMPFMVVIESVSNMIRPLTLSVRLAANMIAGHLLLALLGGAACIFNMSGSAVVIISQVLLVILEVAVAAIQAYVFVVLSSLYLGET